MAGRNEIEAKIWHEMAKTGNTYKPIIGETLVALASGEMVRRAVYGKPVPLNPLKPSKPDVSGTKTSAATMRSEGLTPQRVYSLNNGGGYATKRCRKCHAEYRTRESEPCEPGHIAAATLNVKSYLEKENAAKRVPAKDAGVQVDGYNLPLGSEYMYHRGNGGKWSLPIDTRKAASVHGECQGIKRARHERIDPELCRECYVDLLKNLATGKPIGKETLTVTRRKGKIVHKTVVDVMPNPQHVAIARLEMAKGKRQKRVKVEAHSGGNPAATQPGLFAAIHTQDGVNENKPFRMHVEARTVTEARRLLAECFGKTASEFANVNLYRVVDDGYGSENLKRVA